MPLLSDDVWSSRPRPAIRLALATFGILALELALIRWVSGQVRAFAYFNNVILIAAFLGMGLGVTLAARRPGLIHLCTPLLASLALLLAFSAELGIATLKFPDRAVHLWGADSNSQEAVTFLGSLVVFMLLFAWITAVFVAAGTAVGRLFAGLPTLAAYAWDLGGSLAGVLLFSVATLFNATPPVWLALGAIPFAWLSGRKVAWAAALLSVALGQASVRGALFSPYNRIDVDDGAEMISISVNRDFHQDMHNLSDGRLGDPSLSGEARADLGRLRAAYDLPFAVNDRRGSALVVGAGTGNDVKAALRSGYRQVVSVDIDPVIIDIGRKRHPEAPYADARAIPVVDDARAFFEQYEGEPFDAVVYGLLDSHAMFSSLSTLRLDNYVYTEEGIRAAWQHVADGGHLSISFSVFAGPWIVHRLDWTIFKATGVRPIMIYHGMNFGCTFISPRNATIHVEKYPEFRLLEGSDHEGAISSTSDDWPFLYVRPDTFPWGYATVLFCILMLAGALMLRVYGRSFATSFDWPLFFMGAAFLLIETRAVTALSVLFGSTWIVNSAVFAGVLVMVLAANLAVLRFGLSNLRSWFLALFACVLLLWLLDVSVLNHLPLVARGLLGGLLQALPIGCAGVIVSMLLKRSHDATASLGSNLLGAVVGGSLEYLSMFLGLRALVLLALLLYLGAYLTTVRREPA